MAKRKQKKAKKRAKAPINRRKRPVAKKAARRPATRTKKRAAKPSAKRPTRIVRAKKSKAPETLRTPPSSLDMNRTASAARSGHQAIADNQRRHNKFAAITGGDVDVDLESAYFSGDEGPGGDNPTPDQNDVDELGHAVGIEYAANEELKGSDKVADRDKHRWDNE